MKSSDIAETELKDKPPSVPSKVQRRRDRIEAVATVYFTACKRLARVLNRRSR